MPGGNAAAADSFDVAVIGGGITGMCTAWFLARAGKAVVCLDHGEHAGSTANAGSLHVQMQSRVIALYPQQMPAYEQVLPIYPRAVRFWRQIAQDLGRDIELRITGGLMIAADRMQLEALAEKSTREHRHGVATRLLRGRELFDVAPYLERSIVGASFCELEGKVNPLPTNTAIAEAALASGVQLYRPSRVTQVERGSGGFVVLDSTGPIRAGQVVLAAGAGTGALARQLGLSLRTQAEPLHMNVTETVTPLVSHLVQHAGEPLTLKQLDNGQIVIGGGWPARPGEAELPPALSLTSTLGNLDLARRIVPQLAGARLLRSWAGINTVVDLLAVLGEVPGVRGAYIAIPGDAGYTLGPYCARLLADHMLGRTTDYPLEAFAPGRF